jgi:hypothetical protein
MSMEMEEEEEKKEKKKEKKKKKVRKPSVDQKIHCFERERG